MEQLQEHITAVYVNSMDTACKNLRCGRKPLIIKAVSVAGNFCCNVVVSHEDAALILKENAKSGFLDSINVIIVID